MRRIKLKKIKEKIISASRRGITTYGNFLRRAGFEIGTHFTVSVVEDGNVVKIKVSDRGNTTSRKMVGEKMYPLIDVRRKSVNKIFEDTKRVILEIYNNGMVLVKKLTEEGEVKEVQVRYLNEDERKIVERVGCKNSRTYLDILKFSRLIKARVVSLCSGPGGLDFGFKKKGFHFSYAIDIDDGAVQTYRHNIGNHVTQGDIRDINPSDIPASDILIAGIPCKGFSNANRTQTRGDKHETTYLFRNLLEILKKKRGIKIVVLENVPTFVTQKKGDHFKELVEGLEKLGFIVSWKYIVDKEYGGFTDRKRMILIASKVGEIEFPEPTHGEGEYLTVADAFRLNIRKDSPNQEDRTKHSPETIACLECIPQGGNWRDVPMHIRSWSNPEKERHASTMKRLSWDKPAITLINYRKTLILHPEEHRCLSVREAAALMGLPWNYEFFGKLGQRQQQVADMVTGAMSNLAAKIVARCWTRYKAALKTS